MKAETIFLIGMRGSGKSSVGQLIANALNYEFIDTDGVFLDQCGKSIETFVSEEGWDAFRRQESNILSSLKCSRKVVGTGGGIILSEANCAFMRERGAVIFLDVPVAVLRDRLLANRESDSRPSLTGEDMIDELAAVYEQRIALYRQTAHVCLDGTAPPTMVAQLVVQTLHDRGALVSE